MSLDTGRIVVHGNCGPADNKINGGKAFGSRKSGCQKKQEKGEKEMFDGKLSRIEINGTEYPYKCDMVVLEKIQKEYGDITEFEDNITGTVPYYDDDGIRDPEKDKSTVPDIGRLCSLLVWMIEEGIEISGEGLTPPDADEIKRDDNFTVTDLSVEVYKEFTKSFLSKQARENLDKILDSRMTDSEENAEGIKQQ